MQVQLRPLAETASPTPCTGSRKCAAPVSHIGTLYAQLGGQKDVLLGAEARAAIKGAFDEVKLLGNQAYASRRYDDALIFYLQAQRADPRNTTQMLHAVLSNMSAVHATQGNWRKSFHHVRALPAPPPAPPPALPPAPPPAPLPRRPAFAKKGTRLARRPSKRCS